MANITNHGGFYWKHRQIGRADIRDDTEQEQSRGTVASSLPKSTVASPGNRSTDLAKVAFTFAKYLSSLPQAQCYASEACKAVYDSLPKARDILNRTNKACRQKALYILSSV